MYKTLFLITVAAQYKVQPQPGGHHLQLTQLTQHTHHTKCRKHLLLLLIIRPLYNFNILVHTQGLL